MRWIGCFVALWMVILVSVRAHAADQLHAAIKIVDLNPAARAIRDVPQLTWNPNGASLWLVQDASGGSRLVTRVEGRVMPATASLTETSGKAKVVLGKPGQDSRPFRVEFVQDAASVPLSLVLVGFKGLTNKREFKVETDQYSEMAALTQPGAEKPRRVAVSTWLGYSYNQLTQTGVPDVSQSSVSAKAALALRLGNLYQPPRWQLITSGYITVLPFSVSPSSDYKMRFYGANLRGAYLLHPHPAWTLGMSLGWYYATMTSSPLSFGYRDLSGPQIYLSAARKLGSRWDLGAYFKFSFVNDEFAIRGPSNNEIATGLAATYAPWMGKPQRILFGFDYAHLGFEDEALSITSSSLTFNVGYQF